MVIKRATKKKAYRTTLDYIYDIARIYLNSGNKTQAYSLMTLNYNTFKRVFDVALEKGIIKKIGTKKTSVIYEVTPKGREYIIFYEKMTVYIDKMNIMLK